MIALGGLFVRIKDKRVGILWILAAAGLAALANFSLRRSLDAGASPHAYNLVQFGFSLLLALGATALFSLHTPWCWPIVLLGIVGGLVLTFMLYTLSKALEAGPSSLTFALMNAASVVPAIVMAVCYGPLFGHGYSPWHAAGSLLLLIGLFWAGRSTLSKETLGRWMLFGGCAFAFHFVILFVFQWRALHMRPDLPSRTLLMPIDPIEAASQWFMPFMFLAATLGQSCICTRLRRLPQRREIGLGLLGGMANFLCTFFLMLGTERALPWENVILFPLYCVATLLLSNLWGQVIYKEKVNWAANGVCTAGLAIANIDWNAVSY